MLDVQGRVDVDPAVEQLLDIEVAFRVAAALGVGVGQLVDQHPVRSPGEDSVEIHLLEQLPLVGQLDARDNLEAGKQGLRFRAPMGLDDADDDVETVGDLRPAGDKHLVGLADPRSSTQKDLQATACFRPGLLQQGVG